MDFWRGVPDAGLDSEDRDAGCTGCGEARVAEEEDRERVGLRVVGADQGEEGCFARA